MTQAIIDNVAILWGDNAHDDEDTIRHLLNGGAAYDMRTAMMIAAPSLPHLPPGIYRMTASSLPLQPGPCFRAG